MELLLNNRRLLSIESRRILLLSFQAPLDPTFRTLLFLDKGEELVVLLAETEMLFVLSAGVVD